MSGSKGLFRSDKRFIRGERARFFLYLACIVTVVSISDPSAGLIDIPVSFVLKNQMMVDASEVASFRLIASVPLYLSFLFGLLRDKINERRSRDRELMVLGALCNAVAYLLVSSIRPSYPMLLAASLLPTCTFLIILSAQSGLTAALASGLSSTGPMSAIWNFMAYVSSATAFLVGGYVSQALKTLSFDQATKTIFLMASVTSLVVAAVAYVQPALGNAHVMPDQGRKQIRFKALLRHAPFYSALSIWLLWNFAPGAATPFQFYLQNSLGASDAQWGLWNAIFTASFLPAFALYGLLSFYVDFRQLLFWSAVIAVPQFVPLVFLNTLNEAMLFAVAAGLIGGMATAAFLDLLIRSCPSGFEGTVMMAASTVYFLSTRIGDLLGSYLYNSHGFSVCVLIMTATYASIVVLLRFVPSSVYKKKTISGAQSA